MQRTVTYGDMDVKRALILICLVAIAGCDGESKTTIENADATSIEMFKSKMDEGNKISPLSYTNLRFHPDEQNSSKAISGWVCGDGSMTHSGKTFNFKVRGHVVKTDGISYVGDTAALIAGTEMVKYDVLYNKHCSE